MARAAWLRGAQGVAGQPDPAADVHPARGQRHARPRGRRVGQPSRWICGGTFHAIAHKIIRQHAESFSLPPQFTILDPGDAADILDVLRPDHGLAKAGQRAPRAAACADIYTRCVNTGRPVSQVVTAQFPLVRAVHRAVGRAVPGLHHAQAGPALDGLRRPAAAVAGGAGRPGGRAGAARHVERGPGRRVPGRQRGPGQHRAAAAAGREAADLRGRRRPGHLRVPRRRPGAPAAAGRRLPRLEHRPAGPQLPVQATHPRPGQPRPPVRAWPGPDADRRPRRGRRRCCPLPRRGDPGAGDLRARARGARGRRGAAGRGRTGPRRSPQRHPGNRAGRAQDPFRQVRRAAIHRHRLHVKDFLGHRPDPGQPGRRAGPGSGCSGCTRASARCTPAVSSPPWPGTRPAGRGPSTTPPAVPARAGDDPQRASRRGQTAGEQTTADRGGLCSSGPSRQRQGRRRRC